MTLRTGDRAQYLNVTQADNFFGVFGVKPLLGRTYLPGEDQPGRNNVLVLSYEVWRQQFHGDRDVIGKTANLDGTPYVVIGVMPAGFRFPFGKPNLIHIPMHVRPPWVHSYRDHWAQTIWTLEGRRFAAGSAGRDGARDARDRTAESGDGQGPRRAVDADRRSLA
jgi:hypothetical protein